MKAMIFAEFLEDPLKIVNFSRFCCFAIHFEYIIRDKSTVIPKILYVNNYYY